MKLIKPVVIKAIKYHNLARKMKAMWKGKIS